MPQYVARFGSGDPRLQSGLAPTFIIFRNAATNANVTPPSIAEVGTTCGLYAWTWGTTTPIAFVLDGATTGLTASERYVTGLLLQADRSDEFGSTAIAIGTTNVALGTTNVAIGTTIQASNVTLTAVSSTLSAISSSLGVLNLYMGSTASSFGTDTVDPVDLFGYMRRLIEVFEGNQTFTKTSGSLQLYSRGSSQLLRTKTIANSVSTVVKT